MNINIGRCHVHRPFAVHTNSHIPRVENVTILCSTITSLVDERIVRDDGLHP